MTKHSQDWRETERRLRDLPDHELRSALADAGVRAVLPSDRKPRSTYKPPGELGDSTTRWASGDWQQRISLDGLPDAQKFLENPDKPPTLAVPSGTALSRPSPARRPWAALILGLVGTACVLAVAVWTLRDRAFLDRPRVTAQQTHAAGDTPSTKTSRPASASPVAPQGDTASSSSTGAALAEPPVEEPGLARPAGTPVAPLDEAADARESRRLRQLASRARKGDVRSMIQLARSLVERGDAESAMRWAARAKTKRRNSIEARIVLGDAQMLAGYGKAAEDTWRAALARAPRNPALKQRLGH